MKSILLILLLLLVQTFNLHGQMDVDLCGLVSDPTSPENQITSYQRGGRWITSEGTIKVPVIFVQFPDETVPSDSWPIGQEPAFMRTFIDSTTTENSTNYGNITNFYRQMSMNRLILIGKTYHFVTRYNRSHYGNNNVNLGAVSQEVVQRLDSMISFSEFDNWKRTAEYVHLNQPDGTVDMAIIVHRTFERDYAGITTIGTSVSVDNQQRTVSTGFTCLDARKGDAFALLVSRHEYAHFLLTSIHPYDGVGVGRHNTWSLLEGTQNCLSVNSFERYRLAWIAFTDITADSLQASLGDYMTTGVAYRMQVPGTTDEYFAFENHQRISIYDDASLGTTDKGIQIFHFRDVANVYEWGGQSFDPLTADGNWTLPNPGKIRHPWSSNPLDSIPYFMKGVPNVSGYDVRDRLPTIYPIQWPQGFSVYALQEDDGDTLRGRLYDGENYPYHAFKLGHNSVWSQWSNPRPITLAGQTIPFGMEVQSENSGVVNVKFSKSGTMYAAPSKPFFERIIAGPDGHPKLYWYKALEPDVTAYEVWSGQSSGANTPPSNWYLRATVADTTWIEPDFAIGTGPFSRYEHYKIRAKDSQTKLSTYSNSRSVRKGPYSSAKILPEQTLPIEYALAQNFPNPFNPSTTIRYELPSDGWATLKVYNMLGQEIVTLVDGNHIAGRFQTQWDGKDRQGNLVSTGIYLYRLTSGKYVKTNKMIFVK